MAAPEAGASDERVRVAWIVRVADFWKRDEKSKWLRPCAGAWPSGLACQSRRCREYPSFAERICAGCDYAVCNHCACHSGANHESAVGTCRCWYEAAAPTSRRVADVVAASPRRRRGVAAIVARVVAAPSP